jgi:diguanylate cyclase
MQFLESKSIAYKITIAMLVASGLAVCSLTVALLIYDSLSARSLLQNRLATLSDVIGQNTAAALEFADSSAAAEVLRALRADPPIATGCLYDSSSNLFAEYHREAGTPACSAKNTGEVIEYEAHYTVGRPVLHDGERVGTLVLVSDLQLLKKRRDNLIVTSSLLMLMALGVGEIVGLLLQRKMSTKFFALVRAMHEFTVEQDFTRRVQVSGTDEIAQLGSGFNAMLTELEQRELAKKNAEAKLRFQALNDTLTGLPNRRLLGDRLDQSLAIARRESRIVALLYIDLDGFKLVNDSLGHATGDALLAQVAARLGARVRQSDTLARLGGDEFTVVLNTLHAKEEAAFVATQLLEALAMPFSIEGHELNIGASIGISTYPETAQDGSDLLQQADSAMYASKRNGKNRATYFTPDLGLMVRERLNLENQLRGAVARGEIRLQYQPEFDAASHQLVRFEALVRWVHPTLGMIPPDKFIPISEESGLIVGLGMYILETACAEAVRWQSITAQRIQVAVNISTVQFKREQFVDDIMAVLKHTGLSPELLQLELTESIMLTGVHAAANTIKRLRSLGISLAIDDFGTGYSCLSYLPSLPFDALKIDRSFVKEIATKPESRAMVHSLVALAHDMGMRVIVEGVEDVEQLELIRKYGGNEIQGFLMGRPMSDPASMLPELCQFAVKPTASDGETSQQTECLPRSQNPH